METPCWWMIQDAHPRYSVNVSGMLHAITVSPKPSFRAPQRMGGAVVGRGNAGWTTSKSVHARPTHKGLLQKRLGEDLCWIVPRVTLTTQLVKGLHFGQTMVWVEDDRDAAHSFCLLRSSFAASCHAASNLQLAFLTDEHQLSQSEASCCHDWRLIPAYASCLFIWSL